MALRLIIEDDEGSTTIVPLGQEVVTIGRQQGNTIQLTEKNVSRRHAKLTPEGESWVLEDLGSYNGVKVNGRVASGRAVLQEGDVVQIGDYHLALTEDVDRRSLNYDRARAANDVEPMLVSSSTNLPRLSPAEIAALSSGQHPAQPGAAAAAMPLDSGQMPISRPGVVASSEPAQRRSGATLAIGLVAVGAIALLGFWMISRPDGGATANATTVADGSKDVGKSVPTKVDQGGDAAKPDSKATPEVAPPDPTPDPAPDPTPDPTPAPTTDAKVDPTPDPSVDPDTGEEPVEVPDDDPVAKPNPTSKPRPDRPTPAPTPKKPPPTTSTPPKPTPPAPTPEVDVEALLLEAGKAIFKNNAAQGYELASKAYKSKASSRAAFLMTNAACRMGDKGKASKALAKVSKSSEYYQQALEICRSKGITLD
ncbi:MAG: FHA domain-containing protein [Deltaproteobacteria bacterium]|nr:FHA domain-containing protein [Deltaproteobacteria bacterium]MBK8713580.1 FHA domain-containing protein [Deltaproteobacteria bacterium]MBP7289712.1 FHA domain-containing protein [Nannocystaceae bacterium]